MAVRVETALTVLGAQAIPNGLQCRKSYSPSSLAMSDPTSIDFRRPERSGEGPRACVVIAVLDEAENVAAVCEETLREMERAGEFEIVFVDDGSSDATPEILQDIAAKDPRVRVIRHDRRCGKSQAVRSGVLAARAPWIATMDGDGQNDPADLPDMLEKAWAAEGEAPLVAGTRVRRNDPVSRLVATRIANGFRAAVLGDHCPDTGCGVKVFPREAFLMRPCFEGMHRGGRRVLVE